MNNTIPEQSPPMTPQEPRQRLKDMNDSDRKRYFRDRKAASRQKQKQLIASFPAYEDFSLPEVQRQALHEHSQPILARVTAELLNLEFEDERIITQMAETLLAHKRGWVQQVYFPSGMLYGGIFIDAAVSDAIHRIHHFPALLTSATLSALYREFLNLAQSLVRQSWFDRQFARELEMELAGTFELPRR